MKNLTLAVLPFRNLSLNKDYDYFCLGLSEEVILSLSNLSQITVISRHSSFQFNTSTHKLDDISNALGADIILDGRITFAKDRARISTELIEVNSNTVLWSERWDKTLDDIIEIQDEISAEISNKIRVNHGAIESLSRKENSNPVLFNQYLKGKTLVTYWSREQLKEAEEIFNNILEQEPDHTAALTGLGEIFTSYGVNNIQDHKKAFRKSFLYSNKSLLNEETYAPAILEAARLALYLEFNYSKSFYLIETALAFKPSYADAYRFGAILLIMGKNFELGKVYLDKLLELDPVSAVAQLIKAYFYYQSSDFKKALEVIEEIQQKAPNMIAVFELKVKILILTKRIQEALDLLNSEEFDHVPEIDRIGLLTLCYDQLGKESEYQSHYNRLLQFDQKLQRPKQLEYLLWINTSRNNLDKAFLYIDQLIKDKIPIIFYRMTEPILNNLKKDSRYQKAHNTLFKTEKKLGDYSIENGNYLIPQNEIRNLKNELLKLMVLERPHLDSHMTLNKMAKMLSLRPNQLSWMMNDILGYSFNEFLNIYRVDHFQRLAISDEAKNLTILTLAFESGFSSKASFNNCFKKIIGTTPKKYIDSFYF